MSEVDQFQDPPPQLLPQISISADTGIHGKPLKDPPNVSTFWSHLGDFLSPLLVALGRLRKTLLSRPASMLNPWKNLSPCTFSTSVVMGKLEEC